MARSLVIVSVSVVLFSRCDSSSAASLAGQARRVIMNREDPPKGEQ